MKGPTTPLVARLISATLFGVAALVSASHSYAQPIALHDGNANAIMHVNSSAGMSQWTVDNVNQLSQQWFWYRIGSGANTPEHSINSIRAGAVTSTGTSGLRSMYA